MEFIDKLSVYKYSIIILCWAYDKIEANFIFKMCLV